MKKNHIVIICLIFVASLSAHAQDIYTMSQTGVNYYTSNNCIIYDDGGPNGVYGTNVSSTIQVTTLNNYTFYDNIHLEFAMEESSRTRIELRDVYGSVIYTNSYVTSDTVDIPFNCSRTLQVYFHSDSDNPQGYGFKLVLTSCNSCQGRVSNLYAVVHSDTSAYLKWTPVSGVNDYLLNLSSTSFGSVNNVLVHGDSVMLPLYSSSGDTIFSFQHCDYIHAEIYMACDTLPGACASCLSNVMAYWTQCSCPTSSPNVNRIANGSDGIRNDYMVSWYSSTDTISWICIFTNQSTYASDTVITTDDTVIFENRDTCSFYSVTLYANCHDDTMHDATPPSFCKNTYNSVSPSYYCYVTPPQPPDDGGCPVPLANVNPVYATTNSLTLSWLNDNDSLSWVISIYQDTTLIKTDSTDGNTITFSNLTPATTYTITIYGYMDTITCGMLTLPPVFTYDNCMNYTDFYSPLTVANYGSNALNPYAFQGIVDNGEKDKTSRHTINYDTAARDSLSGYILRTVPEGRNESVRLGNWDGNKSESLTYSYLIDTNINNLLLLRYAVVMKDPFGHTSSNRPRFTLEILDSNGIIIDPVCGYANFVAGENTDDWNEAANKILWKDWTTIGFDVSSYHNKKIKVRLTTRDCADGNPTHCGYAYFTLNCESKMINNFSCGIVDSSSFTAPEGFNYSWYNLNNPSTVISNEQQLNVSGLGTNYYYCIVSNIANPNCKFRIDAVSGNMYPIAAFDYSYTFSDCKFYVTFNNTSFVSSHEEGTDTIGRTETVRWFFPDGFSTQQNTFTRVYYSSGSYLVRIVTGMNNNLCTDTLETYINLESPSGILNIDAPNSLCLGDTITLNVTMNGIYSWSTGDTTQSITVAPLTNTNYSVSVIDSFGCTHTANHSVRVKESYYGTDVYDTICDNYYYAPEGVPLTETGVYPLTLQTVEGCDSIVNLHLEVHLTYKDTIYDSTCSNVPYQFYDKEYTEEGVYDTMFQSIYGCDSSFVLFLAIKPIYTDTLKANIFKGKTFNLFGFNETEEGFYTNTYTGSNGCDSIINLDLMVVNVIFPNVITANGDGINDVFEIHNLLEEYVFPENELFIYNRYGKQIYHRKNISAYSDFWKPDASTPTGTYFYRFIGFRHDKSVDFKGTIDVLR
ncbi:MAG: gliding motility-associated C-terminal domain-containing protein [Bacteroidales bacterium]|jgi:gliding motility-associated-like protein|nr:gliding motility-associated C-terminal domain-containing protein [Bacteroidales bacterium]